MGWTEQDAKQFLDRLKGSKQTKAPNDNPLIGKARRDFGGGTQLRRSTSRAGGSTKQDDLQGLFQARRIATPLEFRKRFQAYQRSLSQSGVVKPTAKPKTGK